MFLLAGGCTALLIAARRREERACAVESQVVRNLERANADLDAFAGRLAHDLRNPLLPIVSGSQLIEHAAVDSRVRHIAERIERSARRLARMIDLMLDFSRVMNEAGGAACDVPAVVAEVVDQLSERAREAGVRIEVECPPLRARCEQIVLESALQNLVDNAIKYGRRDGVEAVVEIRARAVESSISVEVEDRGPGIGALGSEMLFSAFRRGVDGGEGVGLGLATARRFVETRGGTIAIFEGRFGGARFEVRLPAA
jgi:signal transduction histidine kinase